VCLLAYLPTCLFGLSQTYKQHLSKAGDDAAIALHSDEKLMAAEKSRTLKLG